MAGVVAVAVWGYLVLGAAALALVAIGWSFVKDVRKALRTGWVRLGGNTPALRDQSPKFSRSRNPGLYWLGVVLNGGIGAGCIGYAGYLVAIMIVH